MGSGGGASFSLSFVLRRGFGAGFAFDLAFGLADLADAGFETPPSRSSAASPSTISASLGSVLADARFFAAGLRFVFGGFVFGVEVEASGGARDAKELSCPSDPSERSAAPLPLDEVSAVVLVFPSFIKLDQRR